MARMKKQRIRDAKELRHPWMHYFRLHKKFHPTLPEQHHKLYRILSDAGNFFIRNRELIYKVRMW